MFIKGDSFRYNLVWFKTFKDSEEVFSAFDFTCVMGAYDFRTSRFEFDDRFFKDNMRKSLVYSHKNFFPFGSMFRIKKYEDRGFTISKKEFAKIMVKSLQVEIKTVKDLETQLGSMYGYDLSEVFKGVKELNYDIILDKLDGMESLEKYEKGLTRDIEELYNETFGKYRELLSIGDDVYEVFNKDMVYAGKLSWFNEEHVKEAQFPISLYKWVKCIDGEFSSFYKPDFKYEVGEAVESSNGIYVGFKSKVRRLTYANNPNRALIELRVDSADDIIQLGSLYSTNRVKKCTVVRELNYSEWGGTSRLTDDFILVGGSNGRNKTSNNR
jgi:hypothetical protein